MTPTCSRRMAGNTWVSLVVAASLSAMAGHLPSTGALLLSPRAATCPNAPAAAPQPSSTPHGMRVSVMVLSCGDSVQPAAEADQRAGGPVDVPDAVQQPAPAAQRPGVGQVGDGLLHQRAQPRLQAVERPLRVAEPVLGAAVPDRGVPVPAALGQPAEPAVQQGGDLDAVEQLAKPCQLDELVLVAAARPAAVQPQQVAVDGRQRQALGGVGVALE